MKLPFRWGNLVATAALVIGIAIFFTVFLDPLLKCAVIYGGQKALEAKVELAGIETKIFKGKIVLKGFAAADKDNLMTNLVEFKEARFQLLPAPLLEKKVVIQDASIEGLTWGTPRKTSGALPKEEKKKKEEEKESKPGFLQQKLQQSLGQTQDFGLSRMENMQGEAKSKLDTVKPENLGSLKVLNEGETKLRGLSGAWKNTIANQEALIAASAAKIKQDIEAIKNTGTTDVRQIAENAKKAKELEAGIKNLQKGIEETKQKASSDFDGVSKLLEEAKAAKAKDMDALSALLGIPSLDAESIAKMLLGAQVSRQLSEALGYVEMAKKYMPAKSEAPPKLPPKKRGVNIVFPKANAYPTFLWKKSAVTGTAPMMSGPLEFKGEIEDGAYLPSQWAKPLTLELAGKKGTQELRLDAMADHRKENFEDRLNLSVRTPISGVELGKGKELGLTIAQGQADIKLKILRKNEFWEGAADIAVSSARLEPQVSIKGALGGKLADAIRSIQHFTVQIAFKGQEGDLDFSLKSDIGKSLSEALQGMLSAEINKQKKALQDKIAALYKEKASALEGALASKKAEILSPLEKQNGEVKKLSDQLLESSKPKAVASSSPPVDTGVQKLKKLFK